MWQNIPQQFNNWLRPLDIILDFFHHIEAQKRQNLGVDAFFFKRVMLTPAMPREFLPSA